MRFQDKVVIVTGAGAGIGQYTAAAFAREGAKVAVNCTNEAHGLETMKMVEAQGGEGLLVLGDVSRREDVKRIVASTVERFGTVDILINNAGIVLGGHPHDTKEEDWDRMFDVNVKGIYYMVEEVLPYMLEKHHGAIVNNASVAAQMGLKNRYAYSATKGAVDAMSRVIACEYVDQGIRCNTVCPGTILTPSLQYRIDTAPDPAKELEMFNNRQPFGRLGKPEEVAEAMLFAADDAAAFMTGSTISINGGMIM